MKPSLTLLAVIILPTTIPGCVGDLDLEGKECDLDHACPEGYACLPAVSDYGRACYPAEGLCADNSGCMAGLCVLGVCVREPADVCLATPVMPNLECFDESEVGPQAGSDCRIDGTARDLFVPATGDANDTGALTLRVHQLEDILDGDTGNPVGTTLVSDDGSGRFTLTVPVNQDLVFEVQAGQNSSGDEFATMYTFGIYLRANECDGVDTSVQIPAISRANLNEHSNALVEAKPGMGTVFGLLLDCTHSEIAGGTGGISMQNEVLFYFDESGTPQREVDLPCTGNPGLFGAANVAPGKGVASALVGDGSGWVSLHTHWVRAFPDSASLVLFGPLSKPR